MTKSLNFIQSSIGSITQPLFFLHCSLQTCVLIVNSKLQQLQRKQQRYRTVQKCFQGIKRHFLNEFWISSSLCVPFCILMKTIGKCCSVHCNYVSPGLKQRVTIHCHHTADQLLSLQGSLTFLPSVLLEKKINKQTKNPNELIALHKSIYKICK